MTTFAQDIALLRASVLLDSRWYVARYDEVTRLGIGAAEHYLRMGAMMFRDPGPQFSTHRYLDAYPDVADADLNPLVHYLTIGKIEGRAIFAVPQDEPLASLSGAAAAAEAAILRDMNLIQGSNLFDARYYLDINPDVRVAEMDPLRHYIKHGAHEGRRPNPWFATSLYRRTCMNGERRTNPLVHYLTTPGSKNFRTSEQFDGRYYITRYPDVMRSSRTPLEHYLSSGLLQGHQTFAVDIAHTASPCVIDCRMRPCTVIIPVHNAHDALSDCLHSVLRHTRLAGVNSLLVVDDASTDPAIHDLLRSLAGVDGVTVTRQPTNLGYTRTINNALAASGRDDVVLLNSDTVVGPHWLRNLKVAAWRNEHTGTVTAVSDNAGAFSVPSPGASPLPAAVNLDEVARAIAHHAPAPIEVPTGNGFCMYIKRALINAIGGFDETHFPLGYGEENEFCMRALDAGWTHVIDPASFVHHVRSASFGERRQQLADTGHENVLRLHPQYAGVPAVISRSPSFAEARYGIATRLQYLTRSADRPKPRILFVISTRIGGTPQTNADLMRAISGIYDVCALSCDRESIEVLRLSSFGYEVAERYRLRDPVRFATHTSSEYDDVVRGILLRWGIDCLHIRHLAWHSLNLVDVADSLDIPVIYSFHDYYAVSPSLNLVGEDGVYVPTGPTHQTPNPLWRGDSSATAMTPQYLCRWQQRMQAAFAQCDSFVTTNQGARDILIEALPDLARRAEDFHVIPHGRDFDGFSQLADTTAVTDNEPLRILLPGNIGLTKGMNLILQVRQLDTAGKLEFHLLGKGDAKLDGSVVDHGGYQRDRFADKVIRIRPHIAAILSIWPETWCHTLTECWSCGVPALGIDLGAVGERIRRHGGGWLLDHPVTAEMLYAELVRLRDATAERRDQVEETIRWQCGEGRGNTTHRMGLHYLALYRRAMARRRKRQAWPVRRTALVPEPTGPQGGDGVQRVVEECKSRLQGEFGQPVDVLDWAALLRDDVDGYDIIAIQDGAIPASYREEVLALLGETGNHRVVQLNGVDLQSSQSE